MPYAESVHTGRNFSQVMHTIMNVIVGNGPAVFSMYFDVDLFLSRSFQPVLNPLVLLAMTSLTSTYGLVASPYITPVVNFI
jgi:hypothetical protein